MPDVLVLPSEVRLLRFTFSCDELLLSVKESDDEDEEPELLLPLLPVEESESDPEPELEPLLPSAPLPLLLLETLRVLKKGGVFALNDEMKPGMYGDMEAFAQKLRDMGYEEVRLVDTAKEAFGSRRRAAMMMLGESRMLVGRK